MFYPNSYRVTINKTSDLESNTDTLKKLSSTDKPNNQIKLANVGGASLPPGQIKCNILKGKTPNIIDSEIICHQYLIFLFIKRLARAEEEASGQPTKLTNQLFVQLANNTAANNMNLNNDESMSAATFVSVVSSVYLILVYFLRPKIIIAPFLLC